MCGFRGASGPHRIIGIYKNLTVGGIMLETIPFNMRKDRSQQRQEDSNLLKIRQADFNESGNEGVWAFEQKCKIPNLAGKEDLLEEILVDWRQSGHL